MSKLRPQDERARAEEGRSPEFSEALARGIAVLLALGRERRPLTLSDLARSVDLPRATARRALHTLATLGYVASDGRLFTPTAKVLTLAGAYLLANPLFAVLRPACETLASELGHAVSVAVLDGEEVVMVAHASPRQLLATEAGVGFRLPAFCTALGRILLASLPDAELDSVLKRLRPIQIAPATIVDKALLREAIVKARDAGYALVDQEAEAGFRSLAVPVRRTDGTVIAALNVGSRVEQATPAAMLQSHLPRLTEAIAVLQGQLL